MEQEESQRKRYIHIYTLQMMNMCGETAIMVVLKVGLNCIHKAEKRV